MKTTLTTILLMLSVEVLGAQLSPDTIMYKNQAFDAGIGNSLSALGIYFEQNDIGLPSPEDIDNRRGFIAQWEVKTNSLYLVGILQNDLFSNSLNIGEVLSLPATTKEVKATWFTGTMRLVDNEGQVIYLGFKEGNLVDEADVMLTGSLGGACETSEQKKILIDFAKRTFSKPIESIHLTSRWGHPLDQSVAVINFKRQHLGGEYYESSRALIYHQEHPRRIKEGFTNDAVSGPWFTDKKIESRCIVRYTLRKCEIYLGPPDRRVSYNDIQRLLLSIEAKDYATAEPTATRTVQEDGTVIVSSTFMDMTPPDIDAVNSIQIEERDGKLIYEVWTSDHPLSGHIHAFECHDGNFILLSAGFWIS